MRLDRWVFFLGATLTPRDLKKTLSAQGFQIYRVFGSSVLLAERVRENLIMDSGVAAVCGADDAHAVRIVFRAQGKDHPAETEAQLFERARQLAAKVTDQGYHEVEVAVVPVTDPTDVSHVLDTWYEVVCEKGDIPLGRLGDELRFALGVHKAA